MANKQETTYWREQTNLIEQQFNEKNRQFLMIFEATSYFPAFLR